MALDRQDIEKRDFPIGRRGYEPEAVDAHLAAVADQVEQLKRQQQSAPAQRPSPASLASAASEQVRAIVEAAETSAHEIEAKAREEGDRIRTDAEADARQTRDEALGQSRKHLGSVQEATQLMLQRVAAMESELTALIESLRTGANRLNADLSLLDGNLGELYDGAGSGAAKAAAAPAPAPAEPVAPAPEPVASEPVAEPEPAPLAAAEPVAEPAAADDDGGDVEGARLVALNMALNGSTREETDRYLADNFDLNDRAGLLDEVYATVEG